MELGINIISGVSVGIFLYLMLTLGDIMKNIRNINDKLDDLINKIK